MEIKWHSTRRLILLLRALFILLPFFTFLSLQGQDFPENQLPKKTYPPVYPDKTLHTALGIQKKVSSLGYAAEEIPAGILENNPSGNFIRSLSGTVAGISVAPAGGAAGAGVLLFLRGGNSLYGNNAPLLIVDGILYDNSTFTGGHKEVDGITPLTTVQNNRGMDLNPEDIESICILKGPAAAALYGSRAGNGALIVTTKKGMREKIRLHFSSRFTTEWVNRYPEQQNLYGRGLYKADGTPDLNTMLSWGPSVGPDHEYYNNPEDLFRNGSTWNNHLDITGGNKTGSIYFSVSRSDQNGILPTTGYEKTALRFNGRQRLGHRFTIGLTTAYTASRTDKTFTSGSLYRSGGTGVINAAYLWPQTENMKNYLNENGSQYRVLEKTLDLAEDRDNPYWILNKDRLYDKNRRFTGSFSASFEVSRWLDIRYRAGYDRYKTSHCVIIVPGSAVQEIYQEGKLSGVDYTYQYFSSDFMLDFHHTTGRWDFRFLAGQSAEYAKFKTASSDGIRFTADKTDKYENISVAERHFKSSVYRDRRAGIYGDLNISYRHMIYFNITGRHDWLSVLPGNKQGYFYPSVNGAFVFSSLLPEHHFLSYGKIRAAWGQSGTNIPFYEIWGYPAETQPDGFRLNKNSGYEIGMQMNFLHNRLGIDFTYYHNSAGDQVKNPSREQATGYSLYSANLGKIINQGIELTLSAVPVQTQNSVWTLSLNGWGNRSCVYDFPEGLNNLFFTEFNTGNACAAAFAGKSLGSLAGYRWKRDEQSRPVVDEYTGLPVSDKNMTYEAGNREPSFTGGFYNNIRYKNWNFSCLFEFRKGGDIYNGTEYLMTGYGTSKRTGVREELTINGVVNTGTEQEPVYVPKSTTYRAGEKYNINGFIQSGESLIQSYYRQSLPYETAAFITKTNWLRLRAVSVSYDFKNLLKKQSVLKGLTLTATGLNLWLWTNYNGIDPETAVAGAGTGGFGSTGIDYCGVPATAGFSFELSLTF